MILKHLALRGVIKDYDTGEQRADHPAVPPTRRLKPRATQERAARLRGLLVVDEIHHTRIGDMLRLVLPDRREGALAPSRARAGGRLFLE